MASPNTTAPTAVVLPSRTLKASPLCTLRRNHTQYLIENARPFHRKWVCVYFGDGQDLIYWVQFAWLWLSLINELQSGHTESDSVI
jgi:hypothetical protein